MKSVDKGLTLIELVLSVAILSVIILAAVTVLDFGQKSYTVIESNGQLQTEAYNISTVISAEIRSCMQINRVEGISIELVDRNAQNVVIVWDSSASTLSITKDGQSHVLTNKAKEVEFISFGDGVELSIKLISGHQEFELKTKAYRRR